MRGQARLLWHSFRYMASRLLVRSVATGRQAATERPERPAWKGRETENKGDKYYGKNYWY